MTVDLIHIWSDSCLSALRWQHQELQVFILLCTLISVTSDPQEDPAAEHISAADNSFCVTQSEPATRCRVPPHREA